MHPSPVTGEPDAIAALLERQRASLYAVALAVLRDREAAQDAVQEASLVALTRLGDIREPDAVASWLRAVVRNCSLMQLRRVRHEIPSDEFDDRADGPDPEELLERHALRDWIWTALDALPEEERVTLVLRHFTRCRTYEAIAATTGAPVGTVRSRLNRARRRMLDTLAAADGEHRDQRELETSRRLEWESFYRELQKIPEPQTYRDLYAGDVAVRDERRVWQGLDDWSAEEREAIEVGVRASLRGVTASRDLTALEVDFHNPRHAPAHCPPSATFVHHLHGGRSTRVVIYYHR
jgi:RNA polymerase sigma-70 factor (ECF subfamily)